MALDAAHAVLPGVPPPGRLCPDCAREMPRTGCLAVLGLGKPTLQRAYDDALAGNDKALKKHLDPTRNAFEHGTMKDGSGVRPCHFDGWPSWLLAHCQTPKEAFDWVPKLAEWWTPPPPPTAS